MFETGYWLENLTWYEQLSTAIASPQTLRMETNLQCKAAIRQTLQHSAEAEGMTFAASKVLNAKTRYFLQGLS